MTRHDPWPDPKAFQKEKSSAEASRSEQWSVQLQMERYGKIWKDMERYGKYKVTFRKEINQVLTLARQEASGIFGACFFPSLSSA